MCIRDSNDPRAKACVARRDSPNQFQGLAGLWACHSRGQAALVLRALVVMFVVVGLKDTFPIGISHAAKEETVHLGVPEHIVV